MLAFDIEHEPQEISAAAEADGLSDMTLDEINAEISAARENRG